jgi:hypothetical protein
LLFLVHIFTLFFFCILGLSFEENSKHVVAWQAPDTLDNVALSLVKEGDSSNPISIGSFGKYLFY